MHLARLVFATILHRKVWIIWLTLMAVLPVVLPYMTPWEQDMTILEPAHAQAAWVTLWVAALSWGLFQGAGFGESLARRGLGEYFSSQGVGKMSQLAQTWISCLVSVLPLVAAAMVICLVWAMPGDKIEATAWVYTVLQSGFLFTLVFSSLLVLAIGLGTRIGLAGGYLVTIGLALYGLYGVGYMDLFFQVREDVFLETLWTFSPHYHLSDLTERLVFKSGNLPMASFLQISSYLLGLLLIHLGISYLSFKPGNR
jgi:hypothetical protein